MSARKITIDTDPGQDDAFAILLALGSPELDVVAVTAVAGNVPVSKTERNARQILELAGRPDIRVARGCARPMVRPLKRRNMSTARAAWKVGTRRRPRRPRSASTASTSSSTP